MIIGVIGPSKVSYVEEVNKNAKKVISELARVVSESKHEIVVTPDFGSASEFFAKEYSKFNGKKIFSVIPLDDKEFGYSWTNLSIGEKINCRTWRNQPEKFNEETDLLLCIGYAVGVLVEIAYSKWFGPKKIYIIKELVSGKLPKEVEKSLKLEYLSYKSLKKKIK